MKVERRREITFDDSPSSNTLARWDLQVDRATRGQVFFLKGLIIPRPILLIGSADANRHTITRHAKTPSFDAVLVAEDYNHMLICAVGSWDNAVRGMWLADSGALDKRMLNMSRESS